MCIELLLNYLYRHICTYIDMHIHVYIHVCLLLTLSLVKMAFYEGYNLLFLCNCNAVETFKL